MSQQELRRRNPQQYNMESSPSMMNHDAVIGESRGDDEFLSSRYAAGLRVPTMLQASPQQTGQVYKLHIPLLFSVLPFFLQQWMLKFKCLSYFGLLPSWKSRFIILLGRYLYKFSNSRDPKAPPKGRPIAVETVDFYSLPNVDIPLDENAVALNVRPHDHQHIFVVTTHRKKYYFAVPNHDDARIWIHSLQQAKQEAIKRGMGHAPDGSYLPKWTYFDKLGDNLVKTKERILKLLEEGNQRELEMTNMAIGGPTGIAA